METDLDFRLLFEESPDVLLVLLPDAPRFTMVAATRARLTATLTTREQTIGRGLFEMFPDNPDDPAATGTSNLRASLERVLATKAPDTMAVQKYDIRRPDGTFEAKYWSPKNIPILSPSGEVRFLLHRVEDVTELVRAGEVSAELQGRTRAMETEVLARSRELAQANARLRDANAKLGELDAAKTLFFGNVSHELRTPLTLLLGPLEDSLADPRDPLAPAHRARLALAHANALRLLKLVNALLDFSRIEAGRMKARYAPVDVAGLTRELATMFQSAADKAGIALVVDCPPLPEPAWVDREMWEKIVPNLVANALKFTHAGEVQVRVREGEKSFVLEVEDSGIGIPAAELSRIFERFHRVESAEGRTHEGTGIGLSLVRELAQLHGGTVNVESVEGRGSTFRVEIPKGSSHLPPELVTSDPRDDGQRKIGRDARAQASEAERWDAASAGGGAAPVSAAERVAALDGAAASDGPKPRVLVVDDNADLREYLTLLLADRYDVTTAVDGEDALDAIRSNPPDLVVSDVMMPRLDGVGLVQALRADERTALLPVLLLSARAGEESAIVGLDAGSDDYLAKPFTAKELHARVRTQLELSRRRRAWVGELERANKELDAFSYSVAHDLRAPLRTISGFSQALAEDYAGALDDEGRGYIQRIAAAVRRAGELVDALLSLARLSRAKLVVAPVDLTSLARKIVDELREQRPDRQVDVAIAKGLDAKGDRALLEAALTNLLGNAWKFTSRTSAAHIEVGRLTDGDRAFYVRDNGAGFAMEHARHLFAPFQRMHSTTEFEGTGIGLATVQRVVHRHGGKVWAEASEGHGATFFFTLAAEAGPV